MGEGVDDVIDDVTGRPQLATEGAGNVPSRMETEPPVRGNEPSRMEGNQGNASRPSGILHTNVDEAKEFVARKLAAGENITIDLFGGKNSRISNAINFDLVAEEGIRGSVEDLIKIFPDNSVDEIIASGPQAEFLEEAARITKPGGKIYINANFSNRYRYGTRKGKKPPSNEILENLELPIVEEGNQLNPRFDDLDFFRSDGGRIRKDTVKTIIFEKI